jgi:hypothetical protein
MAEVRYHKDVLSFLDGLIDVLIDKEYFSFYEYSAQYMEDLVLHVKSSIALKPHKKAPAHFSRYGDKLLYITYQRSRHTTWYILFQKVESFYFIRHITNNHAAEAQHFNL